MAKKKASKKNSKIAKAKKQHQVARLRAAKAKKPVTAKSNRHIQTAKARKPVTAKPNRGIRTAKARKPKRKLLRSQIARETFELTKASEFKKQVIAPPDRKIELPLASVAKTAERKKHLPHLFNALLGAAIVTLILFAILRIILPLDSLFTIGIGAPVFVGCAIVFYSALEKRG